MCLLLALLTLVSLCAVGFTAQAAVVDTAEASAAYPTAADDFTWDNATVYFLLTDRFNNDSDIDFVVVFDKAGVEDYFDNYFDFKYALQDLLHREVDLVEDQTIRNKYLRQNVDASKQLIYG